MPDQQWQSTDDHAPIKWESTDESAAQDPGFWSGVGTTLKNTIFGMRDLGNEFLRSADSPAAVIAGPGGVAVDLMSKLINGAAEQMAEQRSKGGEEFHRGSYIDGVRHTLAGLVPFVGPQWIGNLGDLMQGQPRAAVGQATTEGILGALPGSPLSRTVTARVGPIIKSRLNPVEAATVRTARQEGIDLSLSLQTGSKLARNLEGMVQNEPGGAGFAAEARATTVAQTQAAMDRKIQQIFPTAVTPEQAGTGVINELKQQIESHNLAADQAYKSAWTAEQDPMNVRSVPKQVEGPGGRWENVLDAQGNPLTEDMPLPVDMRDVKSNLAPLAKQYARTLSDTDIHASLGLKTMREIINGPDFKPASQAEADLGLLKRAADTEAGLKAMRSESQGLAAYSLKHLQDAVDNTMATAHTPTYNPAAGGTSPALRDLQKGRLETASKYDVFDTLGSFGKKGNQIEKLEPVDVYKRMVWNEDTNIRMLRDVAQRAPNEMPKVGRSFLEGLFDTVTREGDLSKVQGALNKWDKLGDEGKKILFKDPRMIDSLDNLFLLMKRIKLEPNPSGSGYIIALSNLKRHLSSMGGLVGGAHGYATGGAEGVAGQAAAGILAGEGLNIVSNAVLARLLYKPAFTQALTQTLQAQISGKGPAVALGVSQLMRIAGEQTQQPGQQQPGQLNMGAISPRLLRPPLDTFHQE